VTDERERDEASGCDAICRGGSSPFGTPWSGGVITAAVGGSASSMAREWFTPMEGKHCSRPVASRERRAGVTRAGDRVCSSSCSPAWTRETTPKHRSHDDETMNVLNGKEDKSHVQIMCHTRGAASAWRLRRVLVAYFVGVTLCVPRVTPRQQSDRASSQPKAQPWKRTSQM